MPPPVQSGLHCQMSSEKLSFEKQTANNSDNMYFEENIFVNNSCKGRDSDVCPPLLSRTTETDTEALISDPPVLKLVMSFHPFRLQVLSLKKLDCRELLIS